MNNHIKGLKSLKILLLIIGFGLIFSFGFHTANAASTVYVSPSGSDSWNGQSSTHLSSNIGPKLTIKSGVNSVSTDGVLNIAKGTYNENNIKISRNMVIKGSNTVINGNHKGKIITINNNVKVNFSGITFINGASDVGGAIYSSGSLTANRCTFKSNIAQYGGAIYNSNILNVFNSEFRSNSATSTVTGVYNGGAIFNTGAGIVNLDNTTFTGNTATYGGAISHTGNSLRITRCIFNMNIAKNSGAAIRTGSNTKTIVTSSTFNGNKANILFAGSGDTSALGIDYGYGGVLYNWGYTAMNYNNFTQNMAFEGAALYNKGILNVYKCNFVNNSATSVAGAVDNAVGGIINLNTCKFINNHADIYGGAIYNDNMAVYRANQYSTVLGNCTIKILNCILKYNTAKVSGGAIQNANGIVNISNSQLTYNTATKYGGAISNNGNGVLTLSNCILLNNAAGTYGGSINNIGTLKVNHNTFSYNKAITGGGAIFNHIISAMKYKNIFTVSSCTFTYNTANTGGAVHNIDGITNISNSQFTYNKATKTNTYTGTFNGGAIYNTGTTNLNNNKFTNNHASSYGGAIANTGVIKAYTCTIYGNTAYKGGVFYNNKGISNINTSTITNNKATINYSGYVFNYFGYFVSTKNLLIGNGINVTYNLGGVCK